MADSRLDHIHTTGLIQSDPRKQGCHSLVFHGIATPCLLVWHSKARATVRAGWTCSLSLSGLQASHVLCCWRSAMSGVIKSPDLMRLKLSESFTPLQSLFSCSDVIFMKFLLFNLSLPSCSLNHSSPICSGHPDQLLPPQLRPFVQIITTSYKYGCKAAKCQFSLERWFI